MNQCPIFLRLIISIILIAHITIGHSQGILDQEPVWHFEYHYYDHFNNVSHTNYYSLKQGKDTIINDLNYNNLIRKNYDNSEWKITDVFIRESQDSLIQFLPRHEVEKTILINNIGLSDETYFYLPNSGCGYYYVLQVDSISSCFGDIKVFNYGWFNSVYIRQLENIGILENMFENLWCDIVDGGTNKLICMYKNDTLAYCDPIMNCDQDRVLELNGIKLFGLQHNTSIELSCDLQQIETSGLLKVFHSTDIDNWEEIFSQRIIHADGSVSFYHNEPIHKSNYYKALFETSEGTKILSSIINVNYKPKYFQVFPNPFLETINVINPNKLKIVLRDLHGKVIRHLSQESTQWIISDLASGTYILSSEDGNSIRVLKQ